MKCKPLVCFGNAYDCKEVIDCFNELPCDKLRLDYIKYPNQFLESQMFFLQHKEYTHFVYLSPDTVIEKWQFKELIKLVEAWDYPVIGGVSNVDTGKYKDKFAACLKLPAINFDDRNYRWISTEQRKYLMENGARILKVKFNALAFCFIKREILENYKFSTLPFETEAKPIWEERGGWACDLAFCHYCDFNDIEIRVDLLIKMKHLRYYGPLQIGIKKPLITFIPLAKHGEQNSPESKI